MQPQAAKEHSITIQWQPDLLGRLCELVFGPPNSAEQPRECGGLLLGNVRRNEVLVRLFTPISCSYQEGELYHLSAADKASLQHSIAAYQSPYWSFIGFYRSHCRPGLELDEEDLQLAREHLKSPPGIFLLVAASASHGSVFLFDGVEFSKAQPIFLSGSRPPDRGAIPPEFPRYPSLGTYQPLASDRIDRATKRLAAVGRQLQAAGESAKDRAAVQLSWFAARLAGKRVRGWLVCTLIVLVFGLFGVWNQGAGDAPGSKNRIKHSVPLKNALGLATSVEGYHVRIAWNPQAPSLAHASEGMLLVTDGDAHFSVPLDGRALTQGSMVYYPTSDVATFELHIGNVTDSMVMAGLGRVVDMRPRPPERESDLKGVSERARDTLKSARALTGMAPNQAFGKTPRQLDQERVSPLSRDSAPERLRAKYTAPPSLRPPPSAPELLQPPDLGVAGNPAFSMAAGLPVSIPPPQKPQPIRSESAVPAEHVEFIAAQAIKQASPQSSGNALRLLVTSVTIRVRVHINSQGRVIRADSLSHGGTLIEYFSNLAVNAAREWLFTPAHLEGRNVESDTVLEFVFDNKGIESSR
jgi:hypothetical protein